MDLTVFGWTVSGQVQSSSGNKVIMRIAEKTTDSILDKLWEREEVPQEKAVQHYLDNYQRTEEGTYSVSLPRIDPTPVLGESRPLALKHFISNERSLKRKNALDQFNANLQEYEDLRHAEKMIYSSLHKNTSTSPCMGWLRSRLRPPSCVLCSMPRLRAVVVSLSTTNYCLHPLSLRCSQQS